jgi:hypothetical protein
LSFTVTISAEPHSAGKQSKAKDLAPLSFLGQPHCSGIGWYEGPTMITLKRVGDVDNTQEVGDVNLLQ